MNVSVVGLLAAVALIVVIWFAFVAPSERRYHQRKLKLMQERIEKREERRRAVDDAERSDRASHD